MREIILTAGEITDEEQHCLIPKMLQSLTKTFSVYVLGFKVYLFFFVKIILTQKRKRKDSYLQNADAMTSFEQQV